VAEILRYVDSCFFSSANLVFFQKFLINISKINMNYLEAAQEITEVIPDIQSELKENRTQNSYSVIQTFTDRIKSMIRQNERNILFKSLKKMDEIYKNGDFMLKNAVENTFIYSLDNYTAFCSEEYRKVIFSHISQDLQKIYSRQIYSHGT